MVPYNDCGIHCTEGATKQTHQTDTDCYSVPVAPVTSHNGFGEFVWVLTMNGIRESVVYHTMGPHYTLSVYVSCFHR